MELRKERVSPKRAAEYLQRNVNNRPLGMSHVNRYANAMLAGEWRQNGESIKFNGNGDLIDGQHRLHACVKAGVPFETVVVRGLPHEAFDTIDQGNKRSLGDVLARRGEKHYNMLAASIRFVHRLKAGWLKHKESLRPDQADKILENNPKLRESVEFAAKHGKAEAFMSFGLIGALHHVFAEIDSDKSTEFWIGVLEGENLTKSMPQYILRKALLENKSSAKKLHNDTIGAFCIKAWNAFLTGKPIKILKWDEREEFPAIAGK